MTAIVYAMMIFLPRKTSAPVTMFFVLFYLSGQHIYALMYNESDYVMDITAYTMLLICKLSSVAFCYQDGCTDPEKLNKD